MALSGVHLFLLPSARRSVHSSPRSDGKRIPFVSWMSECEPFTRKLPPPALRIARDEPND